MTTNNATNITTIYPSPNVAPTKEDVETLMLWLNCHGYAVVVFTPEETEHVGDMDELESRMIERGWDYINSCREEEGGD